MCNQSCILFGMNNFTKEEVHNKRILEIGAIDVNGNLRPVISMHGPSEYIGVDIEAGKGVDIICSAEDVLDRFGQNSFDIVISTEMLEHVMDWKLVVSNIKKICRPGGTILLTTRSYGFKYHGFPYDFWRYEIDDMKTIFADFEIQKLQKDPEMPGVMIKATKPLSFHEKNLTDYTLYSIVTNKRTAKLEKTDFNNLHFKIIQMRLKIRAFRMKIKEFFSAK